MTNLIAVNSSAIISIITISCLILVALGIYIAYKINKNITAKRTQIVIETSLRLGAIKQLNSRYSFDNSISKNDEYFERLKSKSQFDKFNFEKATIEKIALYKNYYGSIIEKLDNNNILYEQYVQDYKKLPKYASPEDITKIKVPYKSYNKIEVKLCDKETLTPVIETNIIFKIRYTSPAGRNSYSNSKTWNYSQVKNLYKKVLEIDEFKNTKEYQRKILSPSLRYDVLKRDNFKCVICGRTEKDGVKLHVDHIKPVAKGGKTELSNLRTLCDECNLGKSDKYDEFGIN